MSLWQWMVLDSGIKGSLLLLIAAGMALALRRSSAAARHMVWTVGLAALLLVAPVSLLAPAWRVSVPASTPVAGPMLGWPTPAERPVESAGRAPQAAPALPHVGASREGGGVRQTILSVWILGAAILGLSFLAGAARLARTCRSARPIDDERIADLAETAARELGVARARFRLRWTDRSITPMTWGFRRPFILLPAAAETWAGERLRQVLVHEIAHVKRWDVLTQALSSLACVLYWPNPLAWWAARRMLVERERACDDLVLACGATPSTYAHELLEIARSLGAGWATSRVSPAMARRSQISGRLLAVLDPERRRHGVRASGVFCATLAGLALVLPAASLRLVPRGSAAFLQVPLRLEDARPEIAAANKAWAQAIRSRDRAAIAGLYTRDSIINGPAGLIARGPTAAADAIQLVIDNGISDVSMETLELYPVGEMVCEMGRATLWPASSGTAVNVRFMTLWKKEDGRWRIHRDIATP